MTQATPDTEVMPVLRDVIRRAAHFDQLKEALSNAQEVIHLSQCSRPSNRGQPCWKECREAHEALLAAEGVGR